MCESIGCDAGTRRGCYASATLPTPCHPLGVSASIWRFKMPWRLHACSPVRYVAANSDTTVDSDTLPGFNVEGYCPPWSCRAYSVSLMLWSLCPRCEDD